MSAFGDKADIAPSGRETLGRETRGLRAAPLSHGCGTKQTTLRFMRQKGQPMSLLKWALIFLVVSIVAAVFGFGGISAASADIARILFFIFVVIFVVLLILGLLAARRV